MNWIALSRKGAVFALFILACALSVSMAGVNAALALLLLSVLIGFPLGRPWNASFTYLVVFFIWAAVTRWLSGPFSWHDLSSLSKLWNLVPCLLIPMMSPEVAPPGRAAKFLGWAAGVSCAVVLLGAVEYAVHVRYFFETWSFSQPLVQDHRLRGFHSHPLHAGAVWMVLALCSGAWAILAKHEKTDRRVLWAVAALVLALGVTLTGSRSYFLGLAVGALLLISARGWKWIAGGVLAGALATAALTASNPYFKQRLLEMRPAHTDESGRQRLFMWRSALWMMKDHPVAGVGYRRWRDRLPEYAARIPDWTVMDPAAFAHAHNAYLTVAAETGLIGLGLFLGFWAAFLREQCRVVTSCLRGSAARAMGWAVLSCMTGLLTAAFFEHNLMTAAVWHAFFFAAGLSRAMAREEVSE